MGLIGLLRYLNNMLTCLQVTARVSKGKCQRGLVNLNLQFFRGGELFHFNWLHLFY